MLNVCHVNLPMLGLLSAMVIDPHDMTNPITEILEVRSEGARMAGSTALVCMTNVYKCGGNVCTHYHLSQHWVK